MQHGRWGILWYLGAMIIIYLMLPWLNRIYRNPSAFVTATAIIALIAHIVFVNNLIPVENKKLDLGLAQTFRLYNWLLYFLIGGLIKRYANFKVPIGVVFGLFVLNIFYQMYLNDFLDTSYCEYYYSSLVVTMLATFLFGGLRNIKLRNNPVIKVFSSLFLPVYVIHIYTLYLYDHLEIYIVNYIYPPSTIAYNKVHLLLDNVNNGFIRFDSFPDAKALRKMIVFFRDSKIFRNLK